MIPRPDIEYACLSCGCAVEAGESECPRCAAMTDGLKKALLAVLADVDDHRATRHSVKSTRAMPVRGGSDDPAS